MSMASQRDYLGDICSRHISKLIKIVILHSRLHKSLTGRHFVGVERSSRGFSSFDVRY